MDWYVYPTKQQAEQADAAIALAMGLPKEDVYADGSCSVSGTTVRWGLVKVKNGWGVPVHPVHVVSGTVVSNPEIVGVP